MNRQIARQSARTEHRQEETVRSLSELARSVGGQLLGDDHLSIRGVNTLADARPGDLSFYGSQRYQRDFELTQASAVLVGEDIPERPDLALVRVKNPNLAFARISQLFHPLPYFAPGVSERAVVHPSAHVHPDATVMPNATVQASARIGARTVLYPGAYVGENAQVGEDCVLYPNAVVMGSCQVGRRCILHAGSVVGADGFGFALDLEKPEHVKIPQAGIARLEDDVELGANSCVDRATAGETVVGKGAKVDNLVQIAHNVQIGPMALLCAQVGVAGSSVIGQGVVLAGQAGVVDHVRVGHMAKVGAQGGVIGNIEDGATVAGHPAISNSVWKRAVVSLAKLPDLFKQVKALALRVELLEQGKKQ